MNDEETLGLPDQDLIDEIRQDEAAQADLLEAQREQMTTQSDAAPRLEKQPKKAESEPEEDQTFLEGVGEYAGQAFKNWSEANMAPAAGTVDFAIDAINMIGQTNIPKFRPFETEYAQASREIASFVIPNIALAQAGTAGAVGLQSKVGWGIGNTKLMKLFGNAGIDIGTGVGVDYINAYSQEGDNLSGTLKKMFPKTYGWISNDWATLDSDSPEVKRAKSINEGAGMGVLSSLLEASGAFLRAANKTEQLTQLVPGNESSKAFFNELERAKYDNKVPEEVFENSVKSQEEALDEIGAYNLSKSTDLDKTLSGQTPQPPKQVDTRGQGKFYHGAAGEFELKGNDANFSGDQGNIYGQGLYLTDDVTTASSYRQKNKPTGEGVVYEADTSKQNFFDLDQPAGDDFLDSLIDEGEQSPEFSSWLLEAAKKAGEGATAAQFLDAMRATSREFDITKQDFQDAVNTLRENLKQKGYTGFTHVGGNKAGKGKRNHQVAIVWDAETTSINKINPDDFLEKPVPTGPSEPMLGVHDAFTDAESGVRTVDPGGVIGAAVDAVRIANNVDTTYGRLGSIVTESALKFGLQADQLPKRTIVKAIVDNLKKGGNFAANVNGKYLPPEVIYKRGEELSEILLDPRMDTGMLKATLDGFKDITEEAGKKLNQTGYAAVMNTIKGYLDEYVNMDAIRASAYFTTSNAGQISDMAEGARYADGSEAVERAQEMILDRLEYLMVEKGLAAHYWGSSLNLLNTWKRFSNDPTILAKSGGNPLEQTDEALSNVVNRSKESIDSLRYIAKERPEFLKPLQLAWEFSDGNIDTLYKLQNFIHESLPNVRKAFLDFQPEIPNQIMQGVWSNIYNSVLSATTTPARAAAGNLGGIIAKPITTFAGAAIARDMKLMRRASYQYFALADTFGKAMHHMAFVFSKASRDPSSVSYIVRDDLVRKNEETMKLLKSSAEAYANEGEMAPMLLYNVAETLQDLGNHPWLRYGANAMTALDGFTRSVLASAEARGQVFDEVFSSGGPVPTKKALKDAADKHYYKMFDTKGMIQNSAVENASREIALNLDTENVKIMSNLVSRVPALRAFIMFPRTSDNVIQMFDKYSPYSAFTEQVNTLAYADLNEMSRIDVKKIAQKYGIPDDEHMYTKVAQLKAETLGRKAVGTAAILGAGFLFTQDRIHGRGHYDKEVQRGRGKDWLPQSIQGFDGRWYSYAELGPVGDWLTFTADIFDNADTLDELTVETLMRKSMFVFGGALTNRSMFAGIEPLFDVLTGNPGAIRRWTASFGSSLAPYSGLRNQLGKLLSPGMRELENDLADAMQNRNRLLDVINPSGALPKAYDWVDGREVGNMGFWTNAWNAIMPMKVAEGMSPEREFLIDIEYDARPTFHKSSKGVEYTAAERSELFRVMGESHIFRDRLRFIMSQKPAKEYRRQIHELRLGQREKVDQKLWNHLHKDVTNAMKAAQKAAEMSSSFQAVIRQRQFQKGINNVLQQQGRMPFFELQNR